MATETRYDQSSFDTDTEADWVAWATERASKDPKPVKDKRGNELSSDDVRNALSNLDQTRMRLDELVREQIEDPEKQAEKAIQLSARWKERREEMKKKLKAAEDYERWLAKKDGVAPLYGMDDDEANQVISEIVDQEAEWYHAENDALKDRVADRVRARLDNLVRDGKPVSVETRDRIYEAMVEKEVIETWEPLEV